MPHSRMSRALSAALAAPGMLMGSAGSLAGRAIGGFLSGMSRARMSVGQTYHDAARRDQTNGDWRPAPSSADGAILDELDTMLARCRHAIANDPWAASTQGGFARLVVGGGITARSAARHPTDPSQVLLRTFNAARDRLWEERCYTPRLVDAEETKTMSEKQRLWMNELVAAGGVFVMHAYRPDPAATRVQLQEIEYEQRDENVFESNGHPVRGGIEVGPMHEPLAYHLFTAEHPLDEIASFSQRVETSRCYHVFRQDRVRQRAGTPWMKPVLLRLRNLAMYERYTMVQARGRAANVGFIAQDDPAGVQSPRAVGRQLGVPSPSAGNTGPAGELQVNVREGLWTVLKPGQKPILPQPATPDAQHVPYVAEQLKGIAASTGMDYTTVARWYADASFAGLRQGRLDLWAEIDWIQDLLFIHKICKQDLEDWVTYAVKEGRLQATGFFEDRTGLWRAAYLETNWQGPPRPSADEIKDEAAWDLKLKGLRASPQDYCNQHGTSPEQVLSEMAEFRALADSHGLLHVADAWLLGSVANRPKEGMAPDDPQAVANSGGLAQLIARQHVLASLLDGGGNGRHS